MKKKQYNECVCIGCRSPAFYQTDDGRWWCSSHAPKAPKKKERRRRR